MATDSIKFYTGIYVALMALATLNYILFESGLDFAYSVAFGGTMVIAAAKTLLVVGYFMHLRWENKSLSYLMTLALALTLLLMAAASYSIS
ncbi:MULTISPECIES: cytochrome C oxidase subunit IV family protein [unclassified Haloparvum]|uniref:cytochrome C oxidase subunit IV family protein n=1 Tax=Haloparvum sp. PAK95 TaxID=3418962 RepID=UPI003D2EE074